MKNGPRLTRVAAAFIAVIEALCVTAVGQTSSRASDSTDASGSLLARATVAPISKVNRFFPEVTREVITTRNMTAVANANATRSVIYSDGDSAKKVTITVDQYPTERDASAAYQEAWRKVNLFRDSSRFPQRILAQTHLSEL